MYQSCFQSEGPGEMAAFESPETVSDVTAQNFGLGVVAPGPHYR